MIGCKIRNITIGISRNCHTSPSILESSSEDQFGVLWEPSFAKAAHGLCKEVRQVLLILGVVYVLGPLFGYRCRRSMNVNFQCTWCVSPWSLTSFNWHLKVLVKNNVSAVTLAGGQRRRKDAVVLCSQFVVTAPPDFVICTKAIPSRMYTVFSGDT